MQAAPIPPEDAKRVTVLCSLNLLDTAPEDRFDAITQLVQLVFDCPIVLISLVDCDRQWFKSRQGLAATETPRDISFCGHTICQEEIFEIPNAVMDLRFADNPLVTGAPYIRFYAGIPITVPTGEKIGTLCLISPTPRTLSQKEKDTLRHFKELVEREIARVDHLEVIQHIQQLQAAAAKVTNTIAELRQSVHAARQTSWVDLFLTTLRFR